MAASPPNLPFLPGKPAGAASIVRTAVPPLPVSFPVCARKRPNRVDVLLMRPGLFLTSPRGCQAVPSLHWRIPCE